MIGALGGGLAILSIFVLDKLKIDDPVGASSVHGTCGAWVSPPSFSCVIISCLTFQKNKQTPSLQPPQNVINFLSNGVEYIYLLFNILDCFLLLFTPVILLLGGAFSFLGFDRRGSVRQA